MSSTYISDRRDDPTDTTSGMYNTVDVALASKVWGAQPNFARMFAQNSTYHQGPAARRVRPDASDRHQCPVGRIRERARGPRGLRRPARSSGAAVGTLFRRRIRHPPRLRLQPSGPSRLGDRLSAGRRRSAFQQRGAALPAFRPRLLGGAVSRRGQRLLAARAHQPELQPAGALQPRRRKGVRFRLPGPCDGPRDPLPHAHRPRCGSTSRTAPNPPRFVGFDGTRQQLLLGTGTFREQRASAVQFHFSLGQTF